MPHARGTFDVQMTPQAPTPNVSDPTVGRLAIDKTFHGDLEATSKGEMLATSGNVEGSAGYVAIERVTGTLAGRTGTFALQHTGLMTRGLPQLTILVVPDSGTGDLATLSGTLTIDMSEGKHAYNFDYTLD